jgi:hypothetical protein
MSEKVCNAIALLIMAVLGIFHTIIEAMGV